MKFGWAAVVASTISMIPIAYAVAEEEMSLGLKGGSQSKVISDDSESVMQVSPSSRKRVDLQVRLFLNGHMASTSRILANLNQKTRITQRDRPDKQAEKEYVIEILPQLKSVKNREMIQMNFRIGTKENGTTQWMASSQHLKRNNEEATVNFQSKNRKYKKIHFKVTPEIVE